MAAAASPRCNARIPPGTGAPTAMALKIPYSTSRNAWRWQAARPLPGIVVRPALEPVQGPCVEVCRCFEPAEQIGKGMQRLDWHLAAAPAQRVGKGQAEDRHRAQPINMPWGTLTKLCQETFILTSSEVDKKLTATLRFHNTSKIVRMPGNLDATERP